MTVSLYAAAFIGAIAVVGKLTILAFNDKYRDAFCYGVDCLGQHYPAADEGTTAVARPPKSYRVDNVCTAISEVMGLLQSYRYKNGNAASQYLRYRYLTDKTFYLTIESQSVIPKPFIMIDADLIDGRFEMEFSCWNSLSISVENGKLTVAS